MKIYGYKDEVLLSEQIEPSELAEITLVANAEELRKIAKFIDTAAEEIERRGKNFDHEHLSEKYPEFKTSPHFIVFNPRA